MTDLMTVAGYTSSDAGTYIKIRVQASNTYGSSAYSTTNVNSIQVQIAPTAQVTTASLSKTKNSITAIWTTSPTSNAGYGYAPITYYLYRYKLTTDSWLDNWITATTVQATSPLTDTISNLTPKTSYDFQIIAANQFGTGPTSPSTLTITTSDIPEPPTAVTVTLNSGTLVNITFTPGSANLNTITGYTVKFQMADGSYQALAGICNSDMTLVQQCNGLSISTLLTSTSRTIGDPILVKVSATNTDGTSADSAVNTVQTVLYMSIPTNTVSGLAVSVTSSTAVSVSWTSLPLSESGYSAVNLYTVEYRLSSDTTWNTAGTSATSPLPVTGLTTLSTYVFRIKASNAFGTGPTTLDANIVSATLYGVPSSPGQPSLT